MAVPKRKKSRSRTRHRRSNWMATARPTASRCSRCSSPLRPHTVCRECGYYGGRKVLDIEL